jgi:hypothetical protein
MPVRGDGLGWDLKDLLDRLGPKGPPIVMLITTAIKEHDLSPEEAVKLLRFMADDMELAFAAYRRINN